jgi:hypothetical protein
VQGEATTVNGQTIATPNLFCDERSRNFQLVAAFACIHCNHGANFFD